MIGVNVIADRMSIALSFLHEEVFRTGGNFLLTSGETSRVYINLRGSEISSRLMRALIEQVKLLIPDVEFSRIVGVPTAGDDFARALAKRVGKSCTVLNKAGKILEGFFLRGERVLLVENVTTSGDSVVKFADALKERGAKVIGVIIFVDRGQGAIEKLSRRGIPPHVLFHIHDLLKLYCDEGEISQELYDEIVVELEGSRR